MNVDDKYPETHSFIISRLCGKGQSHWSHIIHVSRMISPSFRWLPGNSTVVTTSSFWSLLASHLAALTLYIVLIFSTSRPYPWIDRPYSWFSSKYWVPTLLLAAYSHSASVGVGNLPKLHARSLTEFGKCGIDSSFPFSPAPWKTNSVLQFDISLWLGSKRTPANGWNWNQGNLKYKLVTLSIERHRTFPYIVQKALYFLQWIRQLNFRFSCQIRNSR